MTEPGPSAPRRTDTGSSRGRRRPRKRGSTRAAQRSSPQPSHPPPDSSSVLPSVLLTAQAAAPTFSEEPEVDPKLLGVGDWGRTLQAGKPELTPAPGPPPGEIVLQDGQSTTPTIESQERQYLGIPGSRDHNGYRRFPLLAAFSECSDRSEDLEGKHIARVTKNMKHKPINYEELRSGDDLLEQVREELEPKLSSFFLKSELYFLPWTNLYRVLSTHTVLRLLRHLNKTPQNGKRRKDTELHDLAKQIAPHTTTFSEGAGSNGQFRRTFATLILVGRESMIFAFVEHGVNDGTLLKIRFDQLKPKSKEFEGLFHGWRAKDIKDFKSYRWQLSPRFLSVKRNDGPDGDSGENPRSFRKVRHTLHSSEEILPFEPSKRPDISGGFAEVRFFKLHEDQQDLPRYTRRQKQNEIAVKTLKNEAKNTLDQSEAYENEVYVMECLANTLDSPHIAKLLTTIEVSQKVSCNERSDYHLVLEAADRSVDGLLKDQRWRDRVKSEGITSLDLAKWLLDQIFGLCDALREFHEGVEIGQFDNAEHANRCDEKHKKHLLHCDIKPDNILHYEDYILDSEANPKGTVHEKLGVLQLSDFGLSSFHSTRSLHDHTVKGNFLDYTAPETDISLVQSPSTDMWHVGCLIIDLMTWLLEGPDGYQEFREARKTQVLIPRLLLSRFATFSDDRKNRIAIVEVNPTVLKQATRLSEHAESSEFVREMCHLAVNHILVIQESNQESQESGQPRKHVEYSREPQNICERLTSKQVADVLGKLRTKPDQYFEPSAGAINFEDVKWKRVKLEYKHSLKQLRDYGQKVRSGNLNPEKVKLETRRLTADLPADNEETRTGGTA